MTFSICISEDQKSSKRVKELCAVSLIINVDLIIEGEIFIASQWNQAHFSLDWQVHKELEINRSTAPAITNPFHWQRVSIAALSLPHKTPIHAAKRELWALIGWFGSHDSAPGFIFPFRNFLHKAPFDCNVGRCVWSVPPLSNCRPRKMSWRHTKKESWMGLGQLAVPPLSACSRQPWEALAKGVGRTADSWGKVWGKLSLVIQLSTSN